MKTSIRILMAAVILSSGCEPQTRDFVPNFPAGEVEGYRPIYGAEDQAAVAFVEARPLSHPGKIFVMLNYLLVNERYQGIHVFNNTDPAHPKALGFLRIAGNTELAMRNNALYVDHLTDLVALDVSDWSNVRELSRFKQEHWTSQLPPVKGKYFDCPDKARGIVVGWELATLNNPKCFQ